ncbi:type II secretion system F family protein [Leekyejoonella antrihumi]|uniref:Type II secretion system F family protein n=1 Tax=Leekyejoonella antrihumi TaxID=1660198 RepID=A0A563DYG8_9MICO|nr:type II secretion system F family protein [Leekyejoonella antrihumi]TWP35298.1 type II secretion system F family protein [Leekyejoonella antrihumi]
MSASLTWMGVLLGAVAACGVLLAYLGLPFRRRPDLISRMAPYVQDVPAPSRLLAGGTDRLDVNRALAPLMHRLGCVVDHILGGAASVRRRLERAGQPCDVEGFRAQQALWGVLAGLVGTAYVSLKFVGGDASVVTAIGVVVGSVAAGIVARDQMLTRAAEGRERQVLAEFPAVAEMLALAVTAGEGAAAALERVAGLSRGELSAELAKCLSDARAGASLPEALQGLADRTGLPSLARFVDGIVVAVERGTPLADVMRAQAQDARDASKQQLIELGGQREILMMVPVVFLVLPVTILFAIYPGISALNLSI